MVNQIVLIQTAANQESPMLVFPFILKESTTNIHSLVYCTVVAPHVVFQFILIEFYAGSQVGRHEDTFSEAINILRSCHPVQIGGISVSIRILSATIIAVTIDVLRRCKHIETMFLVR